MIKQKVIFFLLFASIADFLFSQNVTLTSSNLPIVVVNTGGVIIPDEPKINARMGIIWNEGAEENKISDPFNNYDGNIAIEIRGSSAQMFPKKSYGFELRDEAGMDKDASLLGMPEEEDWILYGPYSDKSLIRNVVTFTLDGSLGHYSPRCRFVELLINNEYVGLYVLMEKIKRDKNRVDIARLRIEDIHGEELTGGYIIKIDKMTGGGGAGFSSEFYSHNNTRTYYQYEYPKQEEITPEQQEYIYDYVCSFEKSIYDNDFSEETGYRQYIDITSFIDYQIINELARNVDAYRLSTFFYKDKNERLNIGPVWDFNLGYGNANYYEAWLEYGFQFNADLGTDEWQNPFYWDEFRKDTFYCARINERWKELRSDELSDSRVFFVIDSLVNLITPASLRNFRKWNVINQWVWPNYYVGPSWEAEVNWMKNWVSDRLDWLDGSIPAWFKGEIPENEFLEGELVQVGPNPFKNNLMFFIKSGFAFPVVLNIYSTSGVLVTSETVQLEPGVNLHDYESAVLLRQGIYFYQVIKGDDEILAKGKIVKVN